MTRTPTAPVSGARAIVSANYYRGVWMQARHAGGCSGCPRDVFRGETVYYAPKLRRVYYRACAADRWPTHNR